MPKKPIPAKGKTQKHLEGGRGTGGQQVARVPLPSSTAVTQTSAMDRIAANAGAGFEKVTRDDLAIPRFTILQSLSPQVNKRGDDYIDGAEAGMILNTVTGDLYDGEKGVELVIVDFTRSDIEWIPRSAGGGFVKNHGAGSNILAQTKRDEKTGANVLPGGHEIVSTAEYFAFHITEEGWDEKIVVSLAKSDLAEARRLNTVASSYQVDVPNGSGGTKKIRPAYYHRSYVFATVPKENDMGNWFGWKIGIGRETLTMDDGEALYDAASAFRQAVSSGKAKGVDPAAAPAAGGGSTDDSPM